MAIHSNTIATISVTIGTINDVGCSPRKLYLEFTLFVVAAMVLLTITQTYSTPDTIPVQNKQFQTTPPRD